MSIYWGFLSFMNFGLNENIINSFKKVFSKYLEIDRACIFGSRARGDYKETSDIDIVLYGDNLNHTLNTKIFYDLEDLYLIYKIDLINFNSLKDDDKLKENIINEGVEIYVK